MKVKSLICAVLSSVLLCITPIMQMTAVAAEPHSIVAPFYEIAYNAWSDLSISNSNATCKSNVNGENTVKINAVQTLEKQGFLWIWGTYDNTTWTKTANTSVVTMLNTKSGLTKGKYRLKTEFTLTDEYGKSETITVYSAEKSVS